MIISENGNKVYGYKKGTIKTDNGIIITADEFEYDKLRETEVEIKVLYCGICHSDLSVINNEWGFSEYPLVPGHEIVGKIVNKGKKVKNLELGQIVGLGWHSGYCNICHSCMSGDQNLCQNSQATILGHYGGFAELVRAEMQSIITIPDEMDLESLGPLFCGGITVFNPLINPLFLG